MLYVSLAPWQEQLNAAQSGLGIDARLWRSNRVMLLDPSIDEYARTAVDTLLWLATLSMSVSYFRAAGG